MDKQQRDQGALPAGTHLLAPSLLRSRQTLTSALARRPYLLAAGFKHPCSDGFRCPHRVEPCRCAGEGEGEPRADDVSIAAHLLRLRDPATGQPLPDALLAGEFGMFFSAGLETSGNAISWTL